MTKKNEVLKIEEKKELKVVETTPQSMIMQAIEKGASIETMERLFSLQERWEANMAKKAFDNSMADLQAEMPVIGKSKQARDEGRGKELYRYAPLDAIVEVSGPIIGKHGFSYSFKTENTPDKVIVTCLVKHRDGHVEQSTMETGLATKTQIMSSPQQTAATVTFNKRYAFMNAFGITTGGEDDENQLLAVNNKPIDNSPSLAVIRQLIKDAGLKEGKLAEKFNFPCLEDFDNRSLKILEKSLREKLAK